jgi:hypothetical protein
VLDANKRNEISKTQVKNLSGNFFVSILRLHNLKAGFRDRAVIQPYCIIKKTDIDEDGKPLEATEEFYTETVTRNVQMLKSKSITQDLGTLACFIDRKNPMGKLIDLGRVNSNTTTKFVIQVYNQTGSKLIGQCEFTIQKSQEG